MLQNISAAKPYQKVSLKRTKSTKSGMSGKSRVTVKTVECGTGKIRNWFYLQALWEITLILNYYLRFKFEFLLRSIATPNKEEFIPERPIERWKYSRGSRIA